MPDEKGGYRQINKALNICAFEEYLKGQNARLHHIPSVEQITPRVLRVLGQNPGKFTLQGTNTFIVGTGHERLIIDTSGGEAGWAELLASTLQSKNIKLSHILLTHWHGDHTGGVPDLIRLYPHLKDAIYKNEPEAGQRNITDEQLFRVEGATVRAIHVPGHSEDHMCFVLEEEQSMFTGDNILGQGTSAVEDLGTFMISLRKMQAQGCETGHPAHGTTIGNLPSKIASELTLKLRRERQVLQALGRVRHQGEKSRTVADLVTDIYGESLNEDTRKLALEPFIDEVLRKLAEDCLVAFEKRGGRKSWYTLEGGLQTNRSALPANVKVSS
ncbi:MAG: hypothetical protein M1828_005956 [Chrysothrix sp. TS-e1954]|nr:MAG: hypothetical protein M1828_005956 [Chrysothrix sp. TS-e1954]